MNNPTNTNRNRDQLDWSAFCYLTGEMNPVEAEQFELLLAEHQDAREALARAVELTQTVAAAESQVEHLVSLPARPRTAWTTRLAWMAAGSAASLLVALFWSGNGNLDGSKDQASHAAPRGIGRLAAAWSETRAQLDLAKEAGLYPSVVPNIDGEDDAAGEPEALLDDVAMDEAPSWMTTAVYGLAEQSLENTPEPFMDERGEN